jgi:hypothetical protein
MRDFVVMFERVPLMCDNSSAISVAKNLVFHKKMRHVVRRHHFLRDHVEKGDIEMRYIDTERQLADIFIKPLDSSRFTDLKGELVFAIHLAWFEGELVLLPCIFVYFTFLLHFCYTHLSHFVSHVILACICLIMLNCARMSSNEI